MVKAAVLPRFLRLLIILGAMVSVGWKSRDQAVNRITLYLAQPGTPVAITNFVNPNAGCDWWGVGGQVFNEAGRPETGLLVQISGVVDGFPVNQRIVSGSSLSFGAGGYHLQVAAYLPAVSSLRLQVFDSVGRPLSGAIPLPHYRSCSQNLLVMNVRQRSYTRFVHIPFVSNR